MSRAEKGAAQVHRSAQLEHAAAPKDEERRQSDSDAAQAHPTMTDPKLRKGHPSGGDWRDKPVNEERDTDIKHGRIESAARKKRGRS